MKSFIKSLTYAVLTAAIISCQAQSVEEEIEIPSEINEPSQDMILQTFTATTGDVTKTTMDGSGNTVWVTDDQIKVYCTDGSSSSVTLSDGAGTKTGVFSGMVPAGKTGAYAVYPASITSSVDIANSKVTVTVPNEQTLDEDTGGFTTGNIATSIVDAGNKLKFQNVNAFLSVTVSAAVTKVVVESIDGTALASGVDVTYPADPADPITYSNSGNEYSSITLLLPGVAGTYYFSVVPGTHTKGLKFTYYTGSYTETGTYYLNKSLEIERNDNWQFGAFEPTKDYYVKVSGSGGNGLSWSSALTPTQMWNMVTLAAAGDDSDKKAALFAAIDGATFHLGAGDYKLEAAASLAVSEASTLNLTFMGGYPADGGARNIASNATVFTGDDDGNETGDHRILILNGDMGVTFDGITFTKGVTSGSGDARFGGGVWIKAGSHSFVDCTFSSNSAKYGGAIRFDSSGNLTLTRTTFSNNAATDSGDGGALSLSAGTITIINCSFSGNSAQGIGGAIDWFGTTSALSISGGSFLSNTANDKGGAIAVETNASILINNSTQFTSNSATNKGGALSIESKSGSITNRINDAIFKSNHANDGGAVAICGASGKESKVIFSSCTMGTNTSDCNYATTNGGAIYFENNCFVNVGNTTMKHNHANKGGAISVGGYGTLQLFRSYFKSNYAYTGGVVYTEGADSKYANFFVDGCSFEANSITGRYGCIFNVNGINKFSMYNSSAKDSYTKSSDYKTGLYPSWIAVDAVQAGGCVSFGNCSIIGDTWDGNANSALTDGTALIAILGTQTNYFTNCIIVPEKAPGIAAIRGDGDEIIDLYYTHYSNVGNIDTNANSGGNTDGHKKSDFDSINWSSNCWTWSGTISSAAPTMATKKGVYDRINSVCHDFVTWSDTDFVKDQRGVGRGNDNWWPGAYQN